MDKIGKRIRKLRELSGLSQQKLAELLNVQRTTISQVENGERRIYAEELVKLSKIFNISIDGLLDLEKQPEVIINKKSMEGKVKPQIRISVPQKNLQKFKEVLLYILDKVGAKPNVGETVIYKILYFIDFNYYEKYEEQLIGATYIKNQHGPTPIEFQKIVEKMLREKEIEKIKSNYFDYPQTKYLPLREADFSKLKLKADEKEVIDDVLNKLSGMNAKEISKYSHNDVPWLVTEEGKIIQYESVFYRTSPYSVREYVEDIQ